MLIVQYNIRLLDHAGCCVAIQCYLSTVSQPHLRSTRGYRIVVLVGVPKPARSILITMYSSGYAFVVPILFQSDESLEMYERVPIDSQSALIDDCVSACLTKTSTTLF